MSEKPILFSTPMVRALLDGTKTQTRRVVKGENLEDCYAVNSVRENSEYGAEVPCYLLRKDGTSKYDTQRGIYYPKYDVGDILWVRETWSRSWHITDGEQFYYRTDYGKTEDDSFPPSAHKWKPSIHMPRKAARIFLRVTGVRVERVQEITPKDIASEGLPSYIIPPGHEHYNNVCGEEWLGFDWYRELWDSLNAKHGYGWGANPWVWVIEFERVG